MEKLKQVLLDVEHDHYVSAQKPVIQRPYLNSFQRSAIRVLITCDKYPSSPEGKADQKKVDQYDERQFVLKKILSPILNIQEMIKEFEAQLNNFITHDLEPALQDGSKAKNRGNCSFFVGKSAGFESMLFDFTGL